MTTNRLENAGFNSNSLGKTLRSNAPESKRLFHSIRERSITKFILGHALKENILTKRIVITVWRKKEKRRCARTFVSDFYVIIKL